MAGWPLTRRGGRVASSSWRCLKASSRVHRSASNGPADVTTPLPIGSATGTSPSKASSPTAFATSPSSTRAIITSAWATCACLRPTAAPHYRVPSWWMTSSSVPSIASALSRSSPASMTPLPIARPSSRSTGILTTAPLPWPTPRPAPTTRCRDYYWQTADMGFAQRIMPRVAAGIREGLDKIGPRGLLEWPGTWHFIEWGNGRDDDHDVMSAEQAGFVGALDAAIELAGVTGNQHGETAEKWRTARASLVRAVNDNLWDAKRQAYFDSLHRDGSPSAVTSQTTNAAMAVYGIA